MKKLCIVASGGGHTGYAKAIIERIVDASLDSEVLIKIIMPDNDVWSYLRLKQANAKNVKFVQIPKPRGPFDPLHRSIPRMFYSFYQALLRKYDCLVISTGSNHSLVVALASILRKGIKHLVNRKIISLEVIDRIETASKTPMILYKIGCLTVLHWKEQKRHYRKGLVVGPIYEKPRYKPKNNEYILVTTGTVGHEILIKKLLETNIDDVVVQTGKISSKLYQELIKRGWKVFRFDPNIDRWIAYAKIVVAHQGLTAVNAALGYGKPVVLAYNPLLTRSSTFQDTKELAKKINGIAIDPRVITADELVKVLETVSKRKPRIQVDGARIFVEKIIKEYIES